MNSAPYAESNMVLPTGGHQYQPSAIPELIPTPQTAGWYQRQWGCLRGVDPTEIARRHTFPDAVLPRGLPFDPAADSRICLSYKTAWPMEEVDASSMVDTEREHPQFAFRVGGPGTLMQIDVESQLRRLDQPLTDAGCQAVLPSDAPLYQNTVAPPRPRSVAIGPQNAANPIAAIVQPGENPCREAADAVAAAASGRWIHNPTRQDTARFVLPFQPPGIGSVGAR